MTKISNTLVLGSAIDDDSNHWPEVYYVNSVGLNLVPEWKMALCQGLVIRCLGVGAIEVPDRIKVTASVKPLKIKGTRKLLVNPFGFCYNIDSWKYAADKEIPDNNCNGMFRPAHTLLMELFEQNNISTDSSVYQPVWVHVKAL